MDEVLHLAEPVRTVLTTLIYFPTQSDEIRGNHCHFSNTASDCTRKGSDFIPLIPNCSNILALFTTRSAFLTKERGNELKGTKRGTAPVEGGGLGVAVEAEIEIIIGDLEEGVVADREIDPERVVADHEIGQERVVADHEIGQERVVADREIDPERVVADREIG